MAAQEEYITRLLLPVLVGLVGAFLSAFISWIVERARMARENREMQLQKSIEVCTKIIDALDTLYAHLNNDAWYIAWRKATEDRFTFPEELVARDKDRWASYQTSLDEWHAHRIEYETELKGYFGYTGYEAFLFLSCVHLVEEAAELVWKVYYNPRLCPSDESAIPLFSRKDGKCFVENGVLDLSKAGQLKNMEDYFAVIETLKERVAAMSSTMIHCIQRMNVGSLAEVPAPVPEKDREEAEALLGGVVTRRYQSKRSALTSSKLSEKVSGDDAAV